MKQETVETERISLRVLRESDAVDLEQLASEPEVALRTGSIPHPYPEGAALTWIRLQHELGEKGVVETYAITLRATDQFVGIMDLRSTEFAHAQEIGFWVGRPFWGQGICPEALVALVDFAFRRNAELMRIFTLSFPDNQGSARAQEKAGFVREGLLRYGLARLTEPRDAVVSAVTRDEWRARQT